MDKCSILFPNDEIFFKDISGCLKEPGHIGGHLCRTDQNQFIEWEDDYSCHCGCWDNYENDGRVCIIYKILNPNN